MFAVPAGDVSLLEQERVTSGGEYCQLSSFQTARPNFFSTARIGFFFPLGGEGGRVAL